MTRYTITRGRNATVITRTNDPLTAAKARELGFRVKCVPTINMQPDMTDKHAILQLAADTMNV